MSSTKQLMKILPLILFSLFIQSCQRPVPEYHDDFLIFGTIINITLYDVDEKKAEEAFRSMRADLKYMHHAWHVWEPGPLMRTNQLLKTTEEFSAAPSVLDVIKVAKKLSIQSHDLFNPAIGELIALWGFHSNKQPTVSPPDAAIKALVREHPTMRDIEIHGVRIRSSNPAVKIDLGGVAKGYAIDRLLQGLQEKGIHNALVNAGGDLKVIGHHGNRPWKVAIRDPRFDPKNKTENNQGIVASLDVMNNEAVFTSGDYERYVKNKNNKDKHLHHIIDPRTGYPAQGTESVTVLHHNASVADAAATAIFIAGPSQWQEIAKDMGVTQVLLIDTHGNVHISKAMEARVKFEEKRKIVERAEL